MSVRLMSRMSPQVTVRVPRMTRMERRAVEGARTGAARSAGMMRGAKIGATMMRATPATRGTRMGRRRAMRATPRTTLRLGPTAGQARRKAASGMDTARIWSAPRVDRAGAYVEQELGPRLGTMLRRTAERIEPPRPRRRRGLAATLMLAGGILGAAGAMATRRTMTRRRPEEAMSQGTDLSAVPGEIGTERAHYS